MSTKIHATAGMLGKLTNFYLKLGQAQDLFGADELIPNLEADILVADKTYGAAERVINFLQNTGKQSVILPKSSRLEPREHDRELYKARHLIDNFFYKFNSSERSQPDMVKHYATS